MTLGLCFNRFEIQIGGNFTMNEVASCFFE